MLNAKQDRFCLEYLKDHNATQAAVRAGYSERSAYNQGQRLLQLPEVQLRLTEAREKILQESGVKVKNVVDELAKIAFTNITDILTKATGLEVKPFDQLTAAQRASIAEISETTVRGVKTKRVKMHSKLAAMDMLMKHLGGYMTAAELIERLPPERLEELVNEILSKLNK